MSKLRDTPSLQGLLLFVRAVCSRPSCYKWRDSSRTFHDIHQHEGGEQGDPLMPLLFSLAIHDALQRLKEGLFPRELLFAFLDDVHVVCSPNKVRAVFDLLARELSEHAGIQLNEGKTRVWNRAGMRPPHVEDLGPEVWNEEGVKILGTPIGSDRFNEAVTEERLTEERRLWDALAWVPDLQSAWQILLQCAGPRCHHFLRIVPPDQSAHVQALRDRRNLRMSSRHCQWWFGSAVSKADGTRSFLGFLGGRTPHALRSLARVAQPCCGGPVKPPPRVSGPVGKRDQGSRPQRVRGTSRVV